MSIWDGQVSLGRFLSGPNLFGRSSGAVVALTLSPGLANWLTSMPKQEERLRWETRCEAVLGRASPVTTSAHRRGGIRWVHHLLALNDDLRLDYCIEQHPAHVLELSARRMVLFVPCDDPQLGLRTTALSASMLFDCLEAGPEGSPLRLMTAASEEWVRRWRDAVRTWREWAEDAALNPNARWIAREAVRRGLPCYRQPGSNTLLQLGQGVYQRRVSGPFTDAINSVASQWSQDKWQTGALFAAHGLPATQARIVSSPDEALAEARRIGWPVLIKPCTTNKGIGVTVNVRDERTLIRAFEHAARLRVGVLLERHVAGSDHRLLVVGGRFLAAVRYKPADIPPSDMVLPLRGQANLAARGLSEDITRHVHADNRELAEHAARLMGLSTAGLDFRTTDPGRSWREVGGAILSIDAGPDFSVHEPRTRDYDIPKAVVDELFPGGANGRVMTAGVTGSVGKTTTCRMLAKILEHAGHTVGLTSTQGAFIGKRQVRSGDLAGGMAALSLLQDPSLTASVAELARGGLIKRGLGFDALDVGAVLNVQDNHLGLDGIQTREQLAQVKQLVVRYARQLAVLNADDPLCLAMSSDMDPAKVCLVGEAMGPHLAAHQQAGGLIATIHEDQRGPMLRLQRGTFVCGEMPLSAIPATWGAKFRPAMINALFAAALAHGLGISFPTIEQALTTFVSDYSSNPGRMNRISGVPFELWLSWSDGPLALKELSTFIDARRYDGGSKSLVFYIVGNRPDDFIRASAQAVAGTFDRYYCTDMEEDRRGRPVGEVAALLADSLRQSGVPESRTVVAPSTTRVIREALESTPPNGLLVIASYRPDKVMTLVRSLWPEAA